MRANGIDFDTAVSRVRGQRDGREEALLDRVEDTAEQLGEGVAEIVASHLPRNDVELDAPLCVGYGGTIDAFADYIGGKIVMCVELRSMLADPDPDTWMMASAVHESWHAAFLTYIQHHWSVTSPLEVTNEDYRLVFTMLNEGVAHYLGGLVFSGTPEKARDHLLNKAMNEDGDGFYDLFMTKVAEYRAAEEKGKRELIHESHICQDMWRKWGAMTGAMVASALETRLGLDQLRESMRAEPYSLWRYYEELVKSHLGLGPEFQAILNAAQRWENQYVGSAGR